MRRGMRGIFKIGGGEARGGGGAKTSKADFPATRNQVPARGREPLTLIIARIAVRCSAVLPGSAGGSPESGLT